MGYGFTYGLPVDEMTRGISQWLVPLELPNHTPNPLILRACHALSLDDERTTFHPVLWNEKNEVPKVTPPRFTSDRGFPRFGSQESTPTSAVDIPTTLGPDSALLDYGRGEGVRPGIQGRKPCSHRRNEGGARQGWTALHFTKRDGHVLPLRAQTALPAMQRNLF